MAGQNRRITFRQTAIDDLTAIWRYNAAAYGAPHADRYLQMLNNKINRLADHPELGQRRKDLLDCYRLRVQKPRARHGHNIFYQFDAHEIDIIRILHTAQNWQDIIRGIT